MGKNKNIQLDLTKRTIIKHGLNEGKTATEISLILHIHKSTVTREIKHYRYLAYKADKKPAICSSCKNIKTCSLKHKCGRIGCNAKCVGCKILVVCDRYEKINCSIEDRYPFVCNHCKYDRICMRNHYLYDPVKANDMAREIRTRTREGINLTNEEYLALNKVIGDGVSKGQSIYHISKANNLGKTVKTIYNYINGGKLSVKPVDLPRAVSLKKRKTKIPNQYEYNENKNIDRKHRMYSDWLIYQAKNRIIVYWEMDFLGAPRRSEQQILTLTIPQFEFVYLIPIIYPDTKKIKEVFDLLEDMLGNSFEKVFEAILTDRDCKFNCFNEIEINDFGVVRTRIFFCDPAASNEKPSVENFNGQIRAIFKKGVLLSNITFEQCNVISSHLNSRFLNSIDGKRPCDLFIEYFGVEIFEKLNLQIIDPNDVKIVTFKKY